MDVILSAYQPVLQMLGCPKVPDGQPLRLFSYVTRIEEDGRALYFNHLTRELAAVPPGEEDSPETRARLAGRWFLVPEGYDDPKLARQVRRTMELMAFAPKETTNYDIFTTMDCNARCFYCFEKGRPRTGMTLETADRVAAYIETHSGGNDVRLDWFGGEPLYNMPVIDRICGRLRADGFRYTSGMTSNGYLFDDEAVRKAADLWKLQGVQITLDGTEAVYNRAKAYIYPGVNAYQTVKANIGRLLKAGIGVRIRLNYDLYNLENLLELVDELADAFAGDPLISVYGCPLFARDREDPAEVKRMETLLGRQKELDERISRRGLKKMERLRRGFRLNQCMADSGNSVTVLPDGRLGLCEHYSESETIGSIDSETTDEATAARWRERFPEEPRCPGCPDYPVCVRLKHCPTNMVCLPAMQEIQLDGIREAMRNEYRLWKEKAAGPAPDEEACMEGNC